MKTVLEEWLYSKRNYISKPETNSEHWAGKSKIGKIKHRNQNTKNIRNISNLKIQSSSKRYIQGAEAKYRIIFIIFFSLISPIFLNKKR